MPLAGPAGGFSPPPPGHARLRLQPPLSWARRRLLPAASRARPAEVYASRRARQSLLNIYRSAAIHRLGSTALDNEGGRGILKGDEKIAEKLNRFFSTVFTKEKLEETPEPELLFKGREAEELKHIKVTRKEVLDIIDKLDNKSPGPDGIHPRVIKQLKTEIVDLLTKICNLSLHTACVEEDWKIANITTVFKKGSRGDPGNYRPISLTSVPGKIVETVIKNRINKHLEIHALLRYSHHGFSKGRSCLSNLLEFFDGINKYVDNGEPVDIIYLDFQKAFDKVPH